MRRISFLVIAAVSAAALAPLVACSSGDVPVGSANQELKKKKDGGPTGDGKTCSWDDSVGYDVDSGTTTVVPAPNGPYKVGDTFPSLDGCNQCSCTENGIVCTERACAPAPDAGTCTYEGHTWKVGDAVPSLDNCNHCGCFADGIACTAMACSYTCPAEKTIDCMPMVPEERLAECFGPYHDWIAKNCGVTFGL